MAAQSNKEIITAIREEALKEFRVYDANNRIDRIYQAPTSARHGDSCLMTQWGYNGETKQILKRKESVTTWDSSWDI